MSIAPAIRGGAIRAAAIRWAQSGLMSLTGPEHGAPLVPAFDAMAGVDELMDELRTSALDFGARLDIDASVLGGRAHLLSLQRGGLKSCNRSCRLLEARDGWIALSLPRPSDIEMLPAWIGIDGDADPWLAAGHRIKRFDLAELMAMAEDLPLAYAVLPGTARRPRLRLPLLRTRIAPQRRCAGAGTIRRWRSIYLRYGQDRCAGNCCAKRARESSRWKVPHALSRHARRRPLFLIC